MQSQQDLTVDARLQMLHEMRNLGYDQIRFACYRTACKLRFVQKAANLHMVDIWNVIEAFRENSLNTLDPQMEVNVSRLETLISSLYHNLNKRLPPASQVSVEGCAGLLLNWLLAAYTSDNVGKIRVFSIKVALATMCAGKLMDKLRYIFSQISDGAGQLLPWRLGEYLREVLALPAAVYESPSFSYSDEAMNSMLPQGSKVTVNDFMDTMMSDPGPPCLVWLPLLHRLASVENVSHPTVCSACQRENFTGFRYRCQRCHGYQLCQDCFWRGKVSNGHTTDHEVKEYSSYKSPSKQIGHTLRKSFRCVPEKTKNNLPRFPDQPEKTLNLSHIVPPSPVPCHTGFSEFNDAPTGPPEPPSARSLTLDSRTMTLDDEHKLIARYAARLAQENRSMRGSGQALDRCDSGLGLDGSRAQRELITQLEVKNREIMREIARLRRQQEIEGSGGGTRESPALVTELRALRLRKGELEGHLGALQESRKQLMGQLEGLMKMLKTHQASPRSTPNSSPRSAKSPPIPTTGSVPSPAPTRSAPATPAGTLTQVAQQNTGVTVKSIK
ncbi:dystrobrevin beta-like [Ctenocephalides felis]|nr:dystrobrevin beta-like [Ctenocephalides felis]